ncbi:hypothetical protein CPB85DRAFT_1216673, partial [Mucidula mucida]
DIARIVDCTIDGLDAELRKLSLDIHSHPEIKFNERYAHDTLSAFMSRHGFKVTSHYLGLDTAWRAEYTHGKAGKVLGINSEMDALMGIGHACGHNLIAASGCGTALALKAALLSSNTPGKIVLLGTPAEEGGGGKVILLERGAYEEMDICIMCHPSAGPASSASIGSSYAVQTVDVEYIGHSAHAAASPWCGVNALDAAFLAYSSIAVLRQQMKPESRVHGILGGQNWSPNVIPDNAALSWIVRAPTNEEAAALMERVKACFEAASLATGCKMSMKMGIPYYQLIQNNVLGQEFSDVLDKQFGMTTFLDRGTAASTDFVSLLPSFILFRALISIPTEPNGGNHTPAFTKAAASQAAHDATMKVTKGLALTAFRAASDTAFFQDVRQIFLQ